MKDIEHKLEKYSNPYVNGEQRSKEYETHLKQKQAIRKKHQIAENLFNEVPFHLTTDEKNHVHHLINMYPNFKDLHGRASNETIILALIFYTKIPNNTNIKLHNYEIITKYKLKHTTFEIIICRLVLNYLKEVYIIPYEPKQTDHNILEKGKIK